MGSAKMMRARAYQMPVSAKKVGKAICAINPFVQKAAMKKTLTEIRYVNDLDI